MNTNQMTRDRMLYIASIRLYHFWKKLYYSEFIKEQQDPDFVSAQHAAHSALTAYILNGAGTGSRLEALLITCDKRELQTLVQGSRIGTLADETKLLLEDSLKLFHQFMGRTAPPVVH